MNLFSAAISKPMLYVIGMLCVLLLVSNLGWWAHASSLSLQRDVADASRDTAVAVRDASRLETQAWKNKASELAAANLASKHTIDQLQLDLKNAQGEKRRLQQEGAQAIAAAQAAAVDADRTLKIFIDRYAQQLRNPDCAGALRVVQHACPALEGY